MSQSVFGLRQSVLILRRFELLPLEQVLFHLNKDKLVCTLRQTALEFRQKKSQSIDSFNSIL